MLTQGRHTCGSVNVVTLPSTCGPGFQTPQQQIWEQSEFIMEQKFEDVPLVEFMYLV